MVFFTCQNAWCAEKRPRNGSVASVDSRDDEGDVLRAQKHGKGNSHEEGAILEGVLPDHVDNINGRAAALFPLMQQLKEEAEKLNAALQGHIIAIKDESYEVASELACFAGIPETIMGDAQHFALIFGDVSPVLPGENTFITKATAVLGAKDLAEQISQMITSLQPLWGGFNYAPLIDLVTQMNEIVGDIPNVEFPIE